MNGVIVIVDDEPDILELVSLHLTKIGFKVHEFSDVEPFYTFLNGTTPDLVILDLMLPGVDGMDVCKQLRQSDKWAHVPIIMLTARTDEMDKVLGLEIGADDYVTKPFSPRELVARVKAVLRRDRAAAGEKVITVSDIIEIDPNKFEARVKGKRIQLTSTEFRILHLLAKRLGWVYTRDKILDHLWGNEKAVIDRTVDVHIKHLREKLGEAGALVKNVRGVGYKLDE